MRNEKRSVGDEQLEAQRLRDGNTGRMNAARSDSRGRCVRAVLRVPVDVSSGVEYGGHLCISIEFAAAHGVPVAVCLTPAQVETIVILAEIRAQDEGQPEEARGWCLIKEICRRRYVEPDSQRHLLSQIRRRIKKAVHQVAEDVPIPEFLESRRSVGVRIVCPLKIERLDQRPKQSE
jgi:hypothetical protein